MAIFGAQVFTSPTNPVNFDGGRVLGSNSAVFTAGDPVTIDASGTLIVTTATTPIYGVVQKTQTMSSTNATVAFVRPVCIPVDQNYEFLMGTNADLTNTGATTSVGTFYKLTGTTGAVLVDVTSGAMTGVARVVVCTKVDPQYLGGTGAGSGLRQGLFKFVRVTNPLDGVLGV